MLNLSRALLEKCERLELGLEELGDLKERVQDLEDDLFELSCHVTEVEYRSQDLALEGDLKRLERMNRTLTRTCIGLTCASALSIGLAILGLVL